MTHLPHILIADSGATKVEWCLTCEGNVVRRIVAKGISPIFQTEEEITHIVRSTVADELEGLPVYSIYFYGTGCIPEKIPVVTQALSNIFPSASISVYSDLIAATHALCGREAGIACILGTGSNSCEWDGTSITKQVSPLGFILGDEGSGAHIGKLFVGDALKNQLTEGLKEKFLHHHNLTQSTIIESVYRQTFPSRFLASLCPFILQNIEDKTVRNVVDRAFGDFFDRNIMQYNHQQYEVNMIGSIAHHFEPYIRQVASSRGIRIGNIMQAPMPGLINFYHHN